MPPQVDEKILLQPWRPPLEQLGPTVHQALLTARQMPFRWGDRNPLPGRRESVPVQLSAGKGRQIVQKLDAGWHHVDRQALPQPPQQGGLIWAGTRPRDYVGHEPFEAIFLP